MSQTLATAMRGDPADNVGAVIDKVALAAPVGPVFVDATGRRRKMVTGFGWLVALACVAYLGVIGVSLTGTSVGPLPDLPSVASPVVVFGSETDGLPQGALEVPPPAPAAAPAAAVPNFGDAVKVAAESGTAQAAPKVTPALGSKLAPKTAPKKAPTAQRTSSSSRVGGAAR